MTVQQFNPNEASVTLTDKACAYVKQYLAETPGAKGLRFTVKKTGCSGYSYVSEVATALTDKDLPVVIDENLTVFLDADALSLINGIVVDFEVQTLGQKKLTYTNPNETARCGCGESFSTVRSADDEGND